MVTVFMIILAFGVGMVTGRWWEKYEYGTHPDLERYAKLIVANGSIKELKEFTKSKAGYLKEKTFTKLCERIEELTNDDIINEDENNLKVRIASMEDREIELKKLQAESFLQTIKTFKTMCSGGKSR
jgi:hypothetical protein